MEKGKKDGSRNERSSRRHRAVPFLSHSVSYSQSNQVRCNEHNNNANIYELSNKRIQIEYKNNKRNKTTKQKKGEMGKWISKRMPDIANFSLAVPAGHTTNG